MPEPTAPKGNKRRKTRGQSMVEFALVLPLMLMFLVVAADFGRALTAYMTVSSSAAEGASFAARSTENSNNTPAIQAAARNEVGANQQIWGEPILVGVNRGSNDGQGYAWVEVTVNYTFTPMFTVWPIPSSVPMERTVRMRVLGN